MEAINFPTLDYFSAVLTPLLVALVAGVFVIFATDRQVDIKRAIKFIVFCLFISVVVTLIWSNLVGYVLYRMGEDKEAKSGCSAALPMYKQAIQWNPKVIEARSHLIDCRIQQGRQADLPDDFEPLARTESASVSFWKDMARVYRVTSDFQAMHAAANRAIDLDPDNLGWLVDLAVELHSEGWLADAEILLRKVRSNQVANMDAVFWLGQLRFDAGDYADALIQFDLCLQTVTTAKELSRCHEGKGLVLEKLERYFEAREEFNEALELTPDREGLRAALERLSPPPISGTVQILHVEYGVTNAGKDGMLIHLRIETQGAQGFKCDVNAYFSYRDGPALRDTGGDYKTLWGDVAVGEEFTPPYEGTLYNDFTLFMPYSELHTDAGQHHLMFVVHLLAKGVTFAQSDPYYFSYTK